jgi:hypothetical protein
MSELNADRWHAVSQYLDEVLDVPADGRLAWLARFREQHPTLAPDLEALLDEQIALRRERFLEHPWRRCSVVWAGQTWRRRSTPAACNCGSTGIASSRTTRSYAISSPQPALRKPLSPFPIVFRSSK